MKGKKIIVPVLLASLVSTPVVASVNAVKGKVSAASTETKQQVAGPGASITNYTSEVVIGAEAGHSNEAKLVVPTLTTDASVKKVTLTDPLGETVEVTSGETRWVSQPGYYTFSYEVSNTGSVKSTYQEVTVFVKGNTYSMNMKENSYHVVPANLELKTEGTTVKFPVPEVYKNNELLETLDGEIVLKIGDTRVTTQKTDEVSQEKYFEYTFTQGGIYSVRYVYEVGGSTVAVISESKVRLSSDFNTDDIELDFSFASSMPEYAEIGKEVTLPEIDVFDKSNSAKTLDAYTKITVTYLGGETVSESEKTFEVKDFKFTPKYAGTYAISYEGIVPAWGKSTGVVTKRIENIKDTTGPTLYLTNSYSIDEQGNIFTESSQNITNLDIDAQVEALGDISYNLDAYYEVDATGKVTVEIPALFASDNSTTLKEIIENEKTVRELYKYGSSSNKLTLVKTNGEIAKVNEVGHFTFSNTADANGNVWGADDTNYYVVQYSLFDKIGNKRTYSYKLYIRSYNSLPNNGPSITLDPSLTGASVKAGQTLTFSKPVVVDKHDGVIKDENVKTETYYSYTSTTENLVKLTSENVNDSGKFEIANVGTDGNPDKIYIVTKASNHYGPESVKAAVVKIQQANADADAPELDTTLSRADFNSKLVELNLGEGSTITLDEYGQYTNNGRDVGLFGQNANIILPDVTFADDDDSLKLNIYLTYTAPNGGVTKTVDISDFTISSAENTSKTGDNDDYLHTIQNATFNAANAGYYVVTYSAQDSGNNISFKSYGVYVNDTQGPRIDIPDLQKLSTELRPGQVFEIPSAIAIDNGVVDDSIVVTASVSGPECFYKNSKEFRPKKTGSYYVTYTATDGAGYTSTRTEGPIEVKASLNSETFFINYVTTDYKTDYTDEIVYQEGTSIIEKFAVLVPKAVATDLEMGESPAVGKPIVKDGNGVEKTVTEVTNDGGIYSDAEYNELKSKYYQFMATSQGLHTVSYSATNSLGIEATTSYEIEVGDIAAPTLKWYDKAANLPTTVTVGTEWEFDYDFVKIEDEDSTDTIANDGIKVTLSMIDPDKNEINDQTKFTFDKVGNYTFTITLVDKAGNSSKKDYQYTIKVESEEGTTNTINNTTGTILIVTSVIVLGGVVVYFVLSGRKVNAKSKKNSSKKDTK